MTENELPTAPAPVASAAVTRQLAVLVLLVDMTIADSVRKPKAAARALLSAGEIIARPDVVAHMQAVEKWLAAGVTEKKGH